MGLGIPGVFPFQRLKSVKTELIKMHIYDKYAGMKLLIPHDFKDLNTHILTRGCFWFKVVICDDLYQQRLGKLCKV